MLSAINLIYIMAVQTQIPEQKQKTEQQTTEYNRKQSEQNPPPSAVG
jgi:hypothetical protein